MLRRIVAVLTLAVALDLLLVPSLSAHAGLRFSSPLDGATLGDTPSVVQLTMSEKPEASLSSIRVSDTAGVSYQLGSPETVAEDPLSLLVRVRPLGTGVYTVSWRVVSAVDGHASNGAYVFGVRASPTGVATAAGATPSSRFEMLARWMLIAGLVLMLGATAAHVARFGGPRDVALGGGGWLLSIVGLVLLVEAQRRNAGAPFIVLLKTPVGHALILRGAAIAASGIAFGAAARSHGTSARRRAMGAAAAATMAAIAAHAGAGHAAANPYPLTATMIQWAHIVAAGVWLGGLAALLLAVRGEPSATTTAAARRFSRFAATGIFIVAATGFVRAINEVPAWRELTTTDYGRTLLAKILLFVPIAALGAFNRWRSVPVVASNLQPLQRTARGELAIAAAVLVAAAVLGALPPPAAALRVPALSASGSDYGTTVRVELTTASDQPGPNRFTMHAADYDTNAAMLADRVDLRFVPLDDPGVASTVLPLTAGPDGSYVGSGANLAFDGRWQVTVHFEKSDSSVDIPLELQPRGRPQAVTAERIAGEPVKFTVEIPDRGFVRFSPEPERAGPSQVYVTCYDVVRDERGVEVMVVTASSPGTQARQQHVRRLSRSRFVADIDLKPGRNTVGAVARTRDGTRLRAVVDLDITR